MELAKAIQELDRKVEAVKREAELTRMPDAVEACIRSASVTLNQGVRLSTTERSRKRVRLMLWWHKRRMASKSRMVILTKY